MPRQMPPIEIPALGTVVGILALALVAKLVLEVVLPAPRRRARRHRRFPR